VYKDLHNLQGKEQAQALVDFLNWSLHDGQEFAEDLDYATLDSAVVKKVEEAMGMVTFKGEALHSK
jgi:phosphate transport system substrate-binding protein